MVDVLREASEWLEGERDKFLTEPVVYRRGTDTVTLNATRGRTIFEIDDGFGSVERWQSKDFLIFTKDLVFNTIETEPERGDRIEDTVGSRTYIYELMAPPGEPFFRFSDVWRQTLRIHTKQIKVVQDALVTSEGEFIVTSEGNPIAIV